jgi:putative membrane protein
MKKLRSFLILSGIFSCYLVNAQTGTGDNTRDFIKTAYVSNMMEIKNGRLAVKKAKDGGVKSFGSQMVADYSQINGQLNKMLEAKNYGVTAKDTSGGFTDKLLKKSSGTDFDNYYISKTITADKKLVDIYQSALINIKDPAINNFIQKTLPVLKNHLSSVTALAKQLNIKVD